MFPTSDLSLGVQYDSTRRRGSGSQSPLSPLIPGAHSSPRGSDRSSPVESDATALWRVFKSNRAACREAASDDKKRRPSLPATLFADEGAVERLARPATPPPPYAEVDGDILPTSRRGLSRHGYIPSNFGSSIDGGYAFPAIDRHAPPTRTYSAPPCESALQAFPAERPPTSKSSWLRRRLRRDSGAASAPQTSRPASPVSSPRRRRSSFSAVVNTFLPCAATSSSSARDEDASSSRLLSPSRRERSESRNPVTRAKKARKTSSKRRPSISEPVLTPEEAASQAFWDEVHREAVVEAHRRMDQQLRAAGI